MLLQISAASLLASRGPIVSTARAMLQQGLAAVVASDAHSAHSIVLERACAQVESLVGAEQARLVLQENPRRVLAGQDVLVTPSPQPAPPSLLDRLLRRA